MSRPTYQQIEALADFLTENSGIAKGLLRTSLAKQATKRKWDDVAVSLNALGGAQKDGRGWAKYWADKKCALKKACAQHAQSMRRTGGGTDDDLPVLSPLDKKLIAVMGGAQFATGDSHVAVNPFPSTSQNYTEDVQLEVEIPTATVVEYSASPVQIVETAQHTTPSRERSPHGPSQRTASNPSRTRHTRSRSTLDQVSDRFAAIERERVEAEAVTADALKEAVQHLAQLQAAIKEGAETIANALNNIADALKINKCSNIIVKGI